MIALELEIKIYWKALAPTSGVAKQMHFSQQSLLFIKLI